MRPGLSTDVGWLRGEPREHEGRGGSRGAVAPARLIIESGPGLWANAIDHPRRPPQPLLRARTTHQPPHPAGGGGLPRALTAACRSPAVTVRSPSPSLTSPPARWTRARIPNILQQLAVSWKPWGAAAEPTFQAPAGLPSARDAAVAVLVD